MSDINHRPYHVLPGARDVAQMAINQIPKCGSAGCTREECRPSPPGIIMKPTTAATAPGTVSERRKAQPLFQGCLMYFPDALLAVAEHSRKANDKHNPGEPLHWSKDKSKDHADCIARHLLDIGPEWDAVDPEFDSLHATALAWRALALLQTVLERGKK